MARSRKDRIVKFARKNKFNRFLIIALLAVIIFAEHLERAISAKKRHAIAYVTIISFLVSVLAPIVVPIFAYAEEIVVDDLSFDVSEYQDEEEESEIETIPIVPVEVDPELFVESETKEEVVRDGEEIIDDGVQEDSEDDSEQDTLEDNDLTDEQDLSEEVTDEQDYSEDENNCGFDSIDEAMLIELRESERYEMLNDEDWERILDYAREYDLGYEALIEYIQLYIEELLQEEEAENEEDDIQLEPVVDIQTIGFIDDGNLLMGGPSAGLSISVPDMTLYDEEHYSAATGVYVNVGDGYYPLIDGNAFIAFDNEFCGTIEVIPADDNGNMGESVEYRVLIDRTAPTVSVSQTELDDGTIVANININDGENSSSGLVETDLWVDGVLSEELVNSTSDENINGVGENVTYSRNFEYHAEKDGTTVVTVVAYDSVGNATDYTEIIKVNKQYSAMSMRAPSQIELMLDPWNVSGQGTLHSNEFQIVNNSDYDVRVDLKSMLLSVERQTEEALEGLKKVDISVVVLDTGETIRLTEGASHDVFSFVLPCEENGDNTLSLQFVGEISEGSESLWNKGDISMDLVLRYTPEEMDAYDEKEKDNTLK